MHPIGLGGLVRDNLRYPMGCIGSAARKATVLHTQIDWLSFTIPHNPMPDRAGEGLFDAVQAIEGLWIPDDIRAAMALETWTGGSGRSPYKYGARVSFGGIAIYFGAGLTHTLYEFSGTGCHWLRARRLEDGLLHAVASRVTRIDICSDIADALEPRQFVAAGFSERFQAVGSFKSGEGLTEYIGSSKSERYAKVYRYFPPHPRAELLRIEHTLRRDYAKQAVEWILEYGVNYVQASIGKAFGWQHSLWTPEHSEVAVIHVPRGSRSENGTVLWLIKQAAPAFKKAAVKGLLGDPREFLEQWFLQGVDGVQQLGLDFGASLESSEEE